MARQSLILASTSPRRISLLKQAGLRCKTVSPSADETIRKNEAPIKMVKRLAREKALSVVSKLKSSDKQVHIIIAADTIVVAPDGKTVLGKPANQADAVKMLEKLSGRVHVVFTGYCIIKAKGSESVKQIVRAVKSSVKIRKLPKHSLHKYVLTEEPMDKAGAYAAQGIGMMIIEEIAGSYTNVVGLPMSQLIADLELEFNIKTVLT